MSSQAASPGHPLDGRLAHRKARTRAAILEAASRLFHERGYEETSMQLIAEASKTGVGTVYGYFRSKEDLLREVLRRHSDEAVQRYLAAIDESTPALERISAALDSYARYIKESRRLLSAAFQAAARDRRVDDQSMRWLSDSYRQMISEGIARGELRAVPVDATVRLLLGTYSMAMLGIGVWRGQRDDPQTLADLKVLTRELLAPPTG